MTGKYCFFKKKTCSSTVSIHHSDFFFLRKVKFYHRDAALIQTACHRKQHQHVRGPPLQGDNDDDIMIMIIIALFASALLFATCKYSFCCLLYSTLKPSYEERVSQFPRAKRETQGKETRFQRIKQYRDPADTTSCLLTPGYLCNHFINTVPGVKHPRGLNTV